MPGLWVAVFILLFNNFTFIPTGSIPECLNTEIDQTTE